MNKIRKTLVLIATSAVLIGAPLINSVTNVATTASTQPQYQLVCTGSNCGTCCD